MTVARSRSFVRRPRVRRRRAEAHHPRVGLGLVARRRRGLAGGRDFRIRGRRRARRRRRRRARRISHPAPLRTAAPWTLRAPRQRRNRARVDFYTKVNF